MAASREAAASFTVFWVGSLISMVFALRLTGSCHEPSGFFFLYMRCMPHLRGLVHGFHHRAVRHGFLAHLHVLHHPCTPLLHPRIHGRPLLHQPRNDGGEQAQLLVIRSAVHLRDLLAQFGVLSLPFRHHLFFLFLHFLAMRHHFAL